MSDATGRVIEHHPLGADAKLPEGYDYFNPKALELLAKHGVEVADPALNEVLKEARRAGAAQAAREANSPADPGLVNLRNAIKNEYDAAAADREARRRAHAAGLKSNERYYTSEGRAQLAAEFERQLADERDALRDRLAARLNAVEDAVRERIRSAEELSVAADDEDAAIRLGFKLGMLTPANGAPALADLVRASIENPALALEALPHLKSLLDAPGNWQRDAQLAAVCLTLSSILEARPGRARAYGDAQLIVDTYHEIGFQADLAATEQPAPRYVLDGAGNEVPLPGRPGASLEWSGSEDARAMFGNGPSLSGTEPVIATPGASDVDESWRPHGGKIPRGKGYTAEQLAALDGEA